MANIIAKIGIYGDIHLSSKDYGGHRDYPTESLEYFTAITNLTEQLGLTHLIGTGDFTFGRFHKLEYRERVEEELEKQNKITNGNRFEILGNHDLMTNGMSEYQYYVRKGLLKASTNFTVGNLNISMLDYKKDGKYKREDTINSFDGRVNAVIAHQFFKFTNSAIANFGDAILLDTNEALFGTDYLLCGHVHHRMSFSGTIKYGEYKRDCYVQYIGCMTRPAYREGLMDTVGNVVVFTVYDDGKIEFDTHEIPLWPIEKAFNLDAKQAEKEKKAEKLARVDITDIVKQLDAHDRNVGNPEDIINAMIGIDDKYKNKAISLLQNALN